MADVFDEISEDLRREKLNQFWKENGPWIIGGAIGAVLLTGLLTFWRYWEHNRDIAATTELERVVTTADPAKLESFAATGSKKHAMMARFLAAEAYADRKENDKAIDAYSAIANTSGLDSVWRDLARLHSISLRLDKGPPDALAKELEPLTADKNPWHTSARELEGLLAARQGQMQKAADIMAKIAADPQAPEDIRQRAYSLHSVYVADSKNNSKS